LTARKVKTKPQKEPSRFDEIMRNIATLPPSKPKKNTNQKK
jgi:hypothetical protein